MEKKMQKGVSLITLVITVSIMLILAGVAVYFVSKNNIIQDAARAKLETDLKNFNEEMERTYATMASQNPAFNKENVTALAEDVVRKYIPSLTENYAEKITIVKGKMHYESFSKIEMGLVSKLGYAAKKDKLPKNVKVHELNIHPECLFASSFILSDGTFLISSRDMKVGGGKITTDCYLTKLNENFEVEWEKKYNEDSFEKKGQKIISENIINKKNGNVLVEFLCNSGSKNDVTRTVLELNLKGEEIAKKTLSYTEEMYISIPKTFLEEKKNTYVTAASKIFNNSDGKQKAKIVLTKEDKNFHVIKSAEIIEEQGELVCTSLDKDKNGNYVLNLTSYNDNIIYTLDSDFNVIKRGFIKAPTSFGKLSGNCYGEAFYLNNELYNYNAYFSEAGEFKSALRHINVETLTPKKVITKTQTKEEKVQFNNMVASKDGNIYLYGITNKKVGEVINTEGSPYIEKLDKNLNEEWKLAVNYKGGAISSVYDVGNSLYLLGIQDPYFQGSLDSKTNRVKFIIECEF